MVVVGWKLQLGLKKMLKKTHIQGWITMVSIKMGKNWVYTCIPHIFRRAQIISSLLYITSCIYSHGVNPIQSAFDHLVLEWFTSLCCLYFTIMESPIFPIFQIMRFPQKIRTISPLVQAAEAAAETRDGSAAAMARWAVVASWKFRCFLAIFYGTFIGFPWRYYIYMYIYIYTYMHVCIYIFICIGIYIYVIIHIHMMYADQSNDLDDLGLFLKTGFSTPKRDRGIATIKNAGSSPNAGCLTSKNTPNHGGFTRIAWDVLLQRCGKTSSCVFRKKNKQSIEASLYIPLQSIT